MSTLSATDLLAVICASSAVWIITPSRSEQRMSAVSVTASAASSGEVRGRRHAARLMAEFRERLTGRVAREQRLRMREIHALTALATELRAGHPLATSLRNAGGVPSVWPTAESAARYGADISDALRVDAEAHPVFLALAACWQVGSISGSGLARTVEELARSGRAGEDTRAQLDAHLASAHASMRVLAALPALGIAMGMLLGAAPLSWFLSTAIGRVSLGCGLALSVIGLWWSQRITRSVERLL